MKITEFIQEYLKMSRYVALGTLDGILAVMGVTLAASGVASAGGLEIPNYVIGLTGLSGGIALALSNAFGSFIGERAEESRNLRELEQKMVIEEGALDDTLIHRQAKKRIYMSMFTHGFSSFTWFFRTCFTIYIINRKDNCNFNYHYPLFLCIGNSGHLSWKSIRESLLKTSIEIVLIGVLIGIVSFIIGGGH